MSSLGATAGLPQLEKDTFKMKLTVDSLISPSKKPLKKAQSNKSEQKSAKAYAVANSDSDDDDFPNKVALICI